MPNHCYQAVQIHGPRAMVHELYHNLQREEPRFCDVVLPVPFAYSTGMAGYDWRVDHWGTKWDVADVEITDDIHYSETVRAGNFGFAAWFSFRCWTAWGPPILVWDALYALGIEVEADYQDEGEMFAGEYQHGENKSWAPTDEKESA